MADIMAGPHLTETRTGDAHALEDQATRAERMLPEIARRLFTQDPAEPLAELPGAQLKVCSLLLGGPRTMSQISDELSISVSAVTQIADRLEKTEMVARHEPCRSGEGDRRARYLALTPLGASLMESRRQWRVGRVARALARVPEEQRAEILAALTTLLEACRGVGE